MRLLAALALLAGAPAWTVVGLGTPPGHSFASVQGVLVNASGTAVAVGSEGAGTDSRQQAFEWRRGQRTLLAYRGARFVEPFAIDGAGDVLGTVGSTAVLWRQGVPTALGAFTPNAMTDAGAVVVGDDRSGAVVWRNGTLSALPGLGGAGTSARAVARGGAVVGYATLPSGAQHAVVWRRGRPTDLGTVPGFDSAAYGIAPDGTIVGFATVPGGGGEIRALEWRDGQLLDLGSFGAPAAQPVAVNARGDVLVQTETTSQVAVGLRLIRAGKATKVTVPALGRQGLYAVGLDDEDDVVGYGVRTLRGFLWRNGRATLLPPDDQPRALAGGWIVGTNAGLGRGVRLRLRG